MTLQQHWQLDPDLDFLNHGSFGATPKVVMAAQREFQAALERDPIEFLAPERSLNAKLDHVRGILAELVGAEPTDLAFVRNATEGVNAVLGSLPLQPGDEILVTNHGYNACINAARYVAQRSGAEVRVADIPFPLAHARWASLQRRLREQHHFELPVYPGLTKDSWILRISLQVYNDLGQIERLAEVLRNELNAL